MARSREKPKVFVDADVIFAGAASPTEHGASHVVLQMGEITLIDCVSSVQAVKEVERNLADKIPEKLPDFQLLVSRSLHIVDDAQPGDLSVYKGQAAPKDLPILVAAIKEGCSHLLTFNVRHFTPTSPKITVQPPSGFLLTVRSMLGMLEDVKK
jgi:hypothetical protein